MINLSKVLVRPILTEKSSSLAEKTNDYVFLVQDSANKNQIKEAVETFFNVKIEKVRTLVLSTKYKRAGKSLKAVKGLKKAYVRVASGQKIELFKDI